MTREDQFALIVQTMALRQDQEHGVHIAGECLANACMQELPPPDPDFAPAEDLLRLARPYVAWMYSHVAEAAPKPEWATLPHQYL